MSVYADGRMLRKSISSSKTLPQLSESALNVFLMLIPHYTSHGKMNGDPHYIKGEIFPLYPRFTIKKIISCLKEIDKKTNVKWFQSDGLWYLHALDFKKHQNLDNSRVGKDKLPSYSGVSRDLVAPEVEVEVEGKVEDKVEDEFEEEVKGKGNFKPPTPQEVEEYGKIINYPINGEKFVSFYAARGWLIGKNKMKDWRAAVRTWRIRDREQTDNRRRVSAIAGEGRPMP